MLELSDLHMSYGSVKALSGVDIRAEEDEIVAVTGPSSAGKTTTLSIAAGVAKPSSGRVLANGHDVTDVPAWKRDVALVQETYALYPNLTVQENIEFPLRSPRRKGRLSAQEIASRVSEIVEVLEIGHLLAARIQHLSGGQRQRVALARALVREPQAYLLDEPIAHLDAKLRHWLRGELRRRLIASGRPCLWATPDGKEALSVADRVAVLVDGRVVQYGSPGEVYAEPATARVAEIVSEPPITLLKGIVDPATSELILDGFPRSLPVALEGSLASTQGEVVVGVRPSTLRLANGTGSLLTSGQVLTREFTNRETIVSIRLGEQSVRLVAEPFASFQVDMEVTIDWENASVYLFETNGDRRLICRTVIRSGGGEGS